MRKCEGKDIVLYYIQLSGKVKFFENKKGPLSYGAFFQERRKITLRSLSDSHVHPF